LIPKPRNPAYHTLSPFFTSGSEMVREKHLQFIIDIVREKGCATRQIITDLLQQQFNITYKQAEVAADEVLHSLLKRGVIIRKGRGLYCWAGPP
jgi:transposase